MKCKCKEKFAGNQNQAYRSHYESTVTEETNLRPIIAMHLDERFLSLALKSISLEKHGHRAFNWPKYARINLLIS